MPFQFSHPYSFDPRFNKRVAYFCMEFGIHQALKTYAGGLGFLAGSHMRSAFELRQNMVGIGILWKFGYYNQVRKSDQTMDVLFEEKIYGFLEPTNLRFTISILGNTVWATAFYLPPKIFNTVPVFFLTTDLPENDYLSKTISHKLYDSNPQSKMAASILLGEGGARLLELLNWEPEVYHLNESHALPLAFYLYGKYKRIEEVKKHLVFTNHTPESSGNEKNDISLLEAMGYFSKIPVTEVRAITKTEGDQMDHTLAALRLAGKANGVSVMHVKTLNQLWDQNEGICNLFPITNAQNYAYWHHEGMYQALKSQDDQYLQKAKRQAKLELFELVADQCGEIYDENICTIVFAKRFAGYKRPEMFLNNMDLFHSFVTNKDLPVQIIWAGKPYPMDYTGIGVFDKIANICKTYSNCAILVGYELKLSKLLKAGADIWLNVPRLTHEASGTSGMSAAMNGAVNVALPDGWFPEFARDKSNSFVIPACDPALPDHKQDELDTASLYQILKDEVLPVYYNYPQRWLEIMKNGLVEILPKFDSKRMAEEYYEKLYLETE